MVIFGVGVGCSVTKLKPGEGREGENVCCFEVFRAVPGRLLVNVGW
jgi:hypothetical protein